MIGHQNKENLKHSMNENYRNLSREKTNNQQMAKSNTEKAAINIQNMKGNQESKTPKRAKYIDSLKQMKNISSANYASNPNCNKSFNNSFEQAHKNCYQPLKPYYSNIVTLGPGQENQNNSMNMAEVYDDNFHSY